MAKINTTGNGDIDTATAEIAVALRDAHQGVLSDQHYYDEAMELRDAIMHGTRALMVGTKNRTPCPECGGGYWQEYLGFGGNAATDEYIPHEPNVC